jgi:hypothetical protein
MNCVSFTKKFALSIAAIPQMQLRTPAIKTMTPANATQPGPLVASVMELRALSVVGCCIGTVI